MNDEDASTGAQGQGDDVRDGDDQVLNDHGNVHDDAGGVGSGSNGGSDIASTVIAGNQSHSGKSKSVAEEENGKVGNNKESSNIEGSGNRKIPMNKTRRIK